MKASIVSARGTTSNGSHKQAGQSKTCALNFTLLVPLALRVIHTHKHGRDKYRHGVPSSPNTISSQKTTQGRAPGGHLIVMACGSYWYARAFFALLQLMEYNNIEGMIPLTELSRRRIRSVNKHIRVGKTEIVQVFRLDEDKGYIDLSKKKVGCGFLHADSCVIGFLVLLLFCEHTRIWYSNDDCARTLKCVPACCIGKCGGFFHIARRCNTLHAQWMYCRLSPWNSFCT